MKVVASLVINRGDFENVEAEVHGEFVPENINPRYLDPRYQGTTPAHFRNIEAWFEGNQIKLTPSERDDAEAVLFCKLPSV